MEETGVLIHVYNIANPGWKYLAWGDPVTNKLGSLPLLCYLLLTRAAAHSISQIVIHNGPSQKDGLKEGAYTKKFLLDNLERLAEFPSIKLLLDKDPDHLDRLRKHAENIVVGADLLCTADEVAETALLFQPPDIKHVIQIACAGHAPRCLQAQTAARAEGKISSDQLWSVMASDIFFSTTETAADTVIFERPHLAYDPMINFQPTAPEVLRGYFALSTRNKQQFLIEADGFINNHLATHQKNV